MQLRRRDLGALALAGFAGSAYAKPNSNFGGVQIGAITYSFRALSATAADTLQYCLDCGISAIELMSNVAENYAGAPQAGGLRPRGVGRPAMSPEEEAAARRAAENTKQWRLSVPMEKFKALRKMFNDAGIQIYAFKLPPTMAMSDAEYEYIWNVAEAVGANHITMELPAQDELLARVAAHAAKRKLRIAFHTHGQGGSSGFDKALRASDYTALNLDVGHYFGVNGQSPVPVIERYHERIASLHLKDRKAPDGSPRGGANMPWGQGQTPLREVLQSMKRNKFKFPASIEYEYETPAGSDVLAEVKKCVAFCRDALA